MRSSVWLEGILIPSIRVLCAVGGKGGLVSNYIKKIGLGPPHLADTKALQKHSDEGKGCRNYQESSLEKRSLVEVTGRFCNAGPPPPL